MKRLLLATPELAGLVLGLADAVPRALAALAYAPTKASLYGPLLVGNVHHVNGPRAFGLGTFEWFGIGAAILATLYAALRIGGTALRIDHPAFLIARGLCGVIGGILLLNVAEAAITGKVTNYVGLAVGARFTAINGADVLAMLCVAALPPCIAAAFVMPLLARARAS